MTPAALVTGGSTGIGFAIARTLGRAGHTLTVSSRREDRLESAAERLRDEGIEVEPVIANVAREHELGELVAAHERRWGRLDVLVNNAGMGIAGELDELAVKHIDLQLQVNLRAVVLGYHFALPLLRAAGAEHRNALVVNTASIAGERPQPLMPLYAATKAAVVGLTRAMNLDLGPAGIKSTALCPGFVDTEMTEELRGHIPRDEMISADDVAGAVAWLLTTSPQCVVPEIPFLRPGFVE